MSNITKLFTAMLLVGCLVPAFAQAQDKPEKIVLEQKVGSVMTSTGGDYESAQNGKVFANNESMMLAEGAKATVVYYYEDGSRKCSEIYTGPNTYVIDDSCVVAVAKSGSTAKTIGIVAGAALLGGAVIAGGGSGGEDYVPPPVSGSKP